MALFNEFKSSIKSPDTEEKLDLVLYRPFGFLIAKLAHILKMSPTMLSLAGLFAGFLAGFYFLQAPLVDSLIWASFYFVLSGIFDSSDGQLARISGQSTKIGLILDGICDSLVTITVYISCAWPYFAYGSVSFVILVFLGLYFHSFQCAILDFYHREYLYFGMGRTEDDTYWNPSIDDGLKNIERSTSSLEKFMNKLRLSWINKQQLLSTRTDRERKAMRKFILTSTGDKREKFILAYRRHNLKMLPLWRLIGSNAHTFLIITFMFIGRFDIFLVAFDIIIFNLIIFVVSLIQKKADQKFFSEINLSIHEA